MVFSSPIFLFLFLPLVFLLHCLAKSQTHKKSILAVSSLVFYSWWEPSYLILILASIIVNYCLYQFIINDQKKSKLLCIIGVLFNLLLLGYFKYSYFILENITLITGEFSIDKTLLPLGISFFTFQQISFLIDTYKKSPVEYNFLDYALFVTFFPQLIAGPIVHHKEMIPQFIQHKKTDYSNIAKGCVIFSIGMFKKLIVADTFALWANSGFSSPLELTFLSAWLTTISYTVQLYYDFSGYCDMAIGLALLFSIRLPVNFNSPYKAINIQDFWRRWHITLSTWLRDYVYIPLGGNRKGHISASFNVFITFLIGGLWHGAGWNFIIWGCMHGLALATHRAWSSFKIQLPFFISWLFTLMFVHFSWVFFRAEDVSTAITVITVITVIKKMFDFNIDIASLNILVNNSINLPLLSTLTSAYCMIALLVVVIISTIAINNSLEIVKYKEKNSTLSNLHFIIYGALFGFTSLSLFFTSSNSFLYFNF